MYAAIEELVELIGLNAEASRFVIPAAMAVLTVLFALVADLIARRIIVGTLHAAFKKSKATWDDKIADRGVLLRLSRIAPALVVFWMVGIIVPEMPALTAFLRRVVVAYIVVVAAFVLDSLIDVLHDLYRERQSAKRRPIKGLVQLVKVVLAIVVSIVVITTLFDRSPAGILSGLGAMSAVLLLVFRDSILGFVSGVQLSANNLVEIGDWIEMPKYDADGDVIDITLQSIKVRNWDMTITTIPIYALISDSFRNWRGMTESGGRRIKRAVNIDMRSVHFLTEAEIERFKRYSRIRGYLEEREAEIERYNAEHGIDVNDSVSGRRMTNLGTFRAYVQAYLRSHPSLRQDMIMLVRQLPPGPTGIPIEVYVFSADQRWVHYEGIQSDIFDHLWAVLPEFGLRVYQEPSGAEMQAVADAIHTLASDRAVAGASAVSVTAATSAATSAATPRG